DDALRLQLRELLELCHVVGLPAAGRLRVLRRGGRVLGLSGLLLLRPVLLLRLLVLARGLLILVVAGGARRFPPPRGGRRGAYQPRPSSSQHRSLPSSRSGLGQRPFAGGLDDVVR